MVEILLHNIRWLRKHHGLSKREMAKRLGIGLWSLNKIEKGELPPRLHCDILFAVQRVFGVSCEELLESHLGYDETTCRGDH